MPVKSELGGLREHQVVARGGGVPSLCLAGDGWGRCRKRVCEEGRLSLHSSQHPTPRLDLTPGHAIRAECCHGAFAPRWSTPFPTTQREFLAHGPTLGTWGPHSDHALVGVSGRTRGTLWACAPGTPSFRTLWAHSGNALGLGAHSLSGRTLGAHSQRRRFADVVRGPF